MERHEQVQTVLATARAAMSELSAQIVVMRLKDERSIPDIADALHVSEGVVKIRLFRAVQELRVLPRSQGLEPSSRKRGGKTPDFP